MGMCGIAGFITRAGTKARPEDLKAMTDRMVHRGPDDEGFFTDGRVGLGMRRLAIIDVAGGHQPMSNEDGTMTVVFNGEIYNYRELQSALEGKGHHFQTSSDTEVIVHAYEQYGRDCLRYFNGMFAFALYDGRQKALWLVRDRLGIKPLYYGGSDSAFFFSSDLGAFPWPLRQRVNRDALIAYFGHGYVPTPQTIYAGVRKLPPGHSLWVNNGTSTLHRYWDIPAFETAFISAVQAEEQLRGLLEDAVSLQLRSDVPLAVMLSGGLDSSAITAMAAEHAGQPVTTFTIRFTGKGGADHTFARSVADRYRTHHHEIPVAPDDLLSGLDAIIAMLDEPVADSALVPTFLISKAAREQGIRVLLSGAGGDEVFGGYRRHFSPRLGAPAWWAEHLPESLRAPVARAWARVQPHRGFRVLDPRIAYRTQVFGADLGFYQQALTPSVFTQLLQELKNSTAIGRGAGGPRSYSYKRMYADLNEYLLDNILSLSDKATMAASIEGRVPLLDHRIVEFAFALPQEINLLRGSAKGLFKETIRSLLPADLLARQKEGFNAPIASWMDQEFFGKLKEELTMSLSPTLVELLDVDTLRRVFDQPPAQPFLSNTLFALYVFNRWERTHPITVS